MVAWIKIAFRNLVKNGRRSVITIIAISLGYAAVSLFGGFTAYIYEMLQEGAVLGSMKGHLTIFKKGYLEKGKLEPESYLLSAEDLREARRIIGDFPSVVYSTAQLTVNGLISNGRVSTIFIGRGIEPAALDYFWHQRVLTTSRDYEGRPLSDQVVDGIGVARGLAQMIDLHLESTAVVMTSTVDGQINAMDVQVVQLVDIPTSILEDKILMVPLKLLQSLYDTDGADRLVVLLANEKEVSRLSKILQEQFSQRGLPLEVKTWIELSPEYRKTKKMFDVIFLFLFSIVFIIVGMSVINTMSMAVLERIREIGTLRALGLKYRGVLWLFGLESLMLGVSGGFLGMCLTVLSISWICHRKLMWTPPILANPIPLNILYVPSFLLGTFLVMVLLCSLASLLPAHRGARRNVVEALGHV